MRTVFAAAITVLTIGLLSGMSPNIARAIGPTGVHTSPCGSPWTPDYGQAEAVDARWPEQLMDIADLCRQLNKQEGMFATAATTGGLAVAALAVGVLFVNIRDTRRRTRSSRRRSGRPTLI